MTKLTAAMVTAAAFLVALWLVLTRPRGQALRSRDQRPRTRLGATFAVLVTLFVGVLGGLPGQPGAARAASPAPTSPDPAALGARPEWRAVRDLWQAVDTLERVDYDDLQKSMDAARARCLAAFAPLVKDRLTTGEGAAAFCDVLADRTYHKLRMTAATCYDPTMLGAKLQSTRAAYETRLRALAEASRKGALRPDVVEKSRQAMLKEMEMVARIRELFARSPRGEDPAGWEAFRKAEQELLGYFKGKDWGAVDIDDRLPVRPAYEEAVRLVQLAVQP
jgi:hypothetical protein